MTTNSSTKVKPAGNFLFVFFTATRLQVGRPYISRESYTRSMQQATILPSG
jgi:hypothetical protein